MEAMPLSEKFLVLDTAFGPCGVAWSDDGLRRLLLPGSGRSAIAARLSRGAELWDDAAPPEEIAALADAIARYFSGERVAFDGVRADLSAVEEFDRRVLAETRRVVWGSTANYGEIARRLGAPDGARDVGHALARNPIPLVVPCHRVLAAGDRIGGFSAPGGVGAKARMLELEGTRVGVDARQGSLFAPADLRPSSASR